jgi:hypothetical protein
VFILALALFVWGQTTVKKAPPPRAKQDTWQKGVECASQAEKMMAEWPERTGSAPADWKNRYSPKYDKCFVSISLFQASKDEKIFPTLFSTVLFNAFERSSPIASSCTALGHPDCVQQIVSTGRDGLLEAVSKRLNGKSFAEASSAEQEIARAAVDRIQHDAPESTAIYCGIDGKAVDCPKAAAFIAEHMKD